MKKKQPIMAFHESDTGYHQFDLPPELDNKADVVKFLKETCPMGEIIIARKVACIKITSETVTKTTVEEL